MGVTRRTKCCVWPNSWEGYRMICSWVLRDVQRQPASSGYKSKELAGHLVLISISVRLRCVYNAYLMPPFDTDGNRAHDEILSARSLWSTVRLVVGKNFPGCLREKTLSWHWRLQAEVGKPTHSCDTMTFPSYFWLPRARWDEFL